MLRPDSDAPHLEGKFVAHYHTGPLGATTVVGTKLNLRNPRRSSGGVSTGQRVAGSDRGPATTDIKNAQVRDRSDLKA